MIDITNKVVIAVPDSNPDSGYGHITRTINLLSRFQSAKEIYLIIADSILSRLNLKVPFNHFSQINILPNSVYQFEVLLILDSYDYEYCASIYFKTLSFVATSQLRVLTICDTYIQAKNMLSHIPSTDLLFPNMIDHDLRSNIVNLCKTHNCALYDGYPFILLDKCTIDSSSASNCRPNLASQNPVCLISFGFSSFEFTPQFLGHCRQVLFRLSSQFHAINFCILGPNALRLFINLGMCESISSYHQFLSKPDLIKLYDTSSFYFGSLGYSMWERAFRLLPSFVYPIAENQISYVAIGKSLCLLCSSHDVLKNDFNLYISLDTMKQGTLKFKETINQQSIF